MLLNTVVVIFLFFLLRRFHASDDLCRLIELDIANGQLPWKWNELEQRLFYRTDLLCQNKPVFRSLYDENLVQFQSRNNRWWTLYQIENRTEPAGSRQWCDGWNMKPILAMPVGLFQQAWNKQKRFQRWHRVFHHPKNQSFTYKLRPNIHLKCYYPLATTTCQTRQLTFLFDLTATTTKEDFQAMKLWSKTLIWLLINQTRLALTTFSDRLHLVHSFDNQTAWKSIEHLFDSIESLNEYRQKLRRTSIPWIETIHQIVTKIYKRRFPLPLDLLHLVQQNSTNATESSEEEIYTEPYPLIDDDDLAIRTHLNISAFRERKKRAIRNPFNKSNHVLVILTTRSKSLYDYTERDRRLAEWISSVPLRIVVIDFNARSNRKTAESIHSVLFHRAKLALASPPRFYNYIETFEDKGDSLHDEQLFDHFHRLCYPTEDNQRNTTFIETSPTANVDCSLVHLSNNSNSNRTLNEQIEYTFYQTTEQCFSASVYRSLADRNLYLQRLSNGRWVVTRVDPLLPSTAMLKAQAASTTTTTLAPEFLSATEYAYGQWFDEHSSDTVLRDLPVSVPHCSDYPGLEILWQTDNYFLYDNRSFRTPHSWFSYPNQTEILTSTCNQYQIACRTRSFDLLVVVDCQEEYSSLLKTFLRTLIALIELVNHRFSLVVLSSTSLDPFQFHLPLISMDRLKEINLEQYFVYLDKSNNSAMELDQHLQRLSDYVLNNGLSSSTPIVLTISSRLNFNQSKMIELIQRYSAIRYMTVDPQLKQNLHYDSQRNRLLRALTSKPFYGNLYRSYAANRDLTFETVFYLLENLCGILQ